eukprot:2759590-Rhodomonas_salina.1
MSSKAALQGPQTLVARVLASFSASHTKVGLRQWLDQPASRPTTATAGSARACPELDRCRGASQDSTCSCHVLGH